MRQLATSGRGSFQKASTEANDFVRSPTASRRLLMASRTEASSSTIKMIERNSDIQTAGCGQCKLENRAAGRPRGCPQPPFMRFNDGTAERQPKPDSLRLGREEWRENLLGRQCIQSFAGIFDSHDH